MSKRMKLTNEQMAEVQRMGLGDAIKAITDALGIKQCRGCRDRQELLNHVRLPLKAKPR